MSSDQNAKKSVKEARRSSLKNTESKPQGALLKLKEKRNSVSWGKSDTFQFKQMKATFQESKDVDDNDPGLTSDWKEKWPETDTYETFTMPQTFYQTEYEDFKGSIWLQKTVDVKEKESKHKEFVENRRKSIKDEFSLVKEALKKKIIEEDDEETNDELKKNTENNIKLGHDALNEASSESSSSENSEGEN